MGHGLLLPFSRDVRSGALDGIATTAGSGARPDGDQAAVLLPAGRRFVFWIGAESDPGASVGSPRTQPGGARFLPGGELRPRTPHPDRGHRKGPARPLLRVAARPDVVRIVGPARQQGPAAHHRGRGPGRAGPSAAGVGPGASGVRRTAGGMGIRRPGFVDDSALRGGGEREPAEDLLGFVFGAELRRKPVFSRGGPDIRDRPLTNST